MDAGTAPAQRSKRRTEFEGEASAASAVADPFGDDPFAPPDKKRAQAAPNAPAAGARAPAAAKQKRVTKFDSGTSKDDPFRPTEPADDERFAGRRIVGWLITFDRHADGRSWKIREGRNVIGRDDACDVVIDDDDKVSNAHAVLVWRGGMSRLDDKMSQNGTYLNEADVMQPEQVNDGDVLRVGRTRMICRLLDAQQIDRVFPQDKG